MWSCCCACHSITPCKIKFYLDYFCLIVAKYSVSSMSSELKIATLPESPCTSHVIPSFV